MRVKERQKICRNKHKMRKEKERKTEVMQIQTNCKKERWKKTLTKILNKKERQRNRHKIERKTNRSEKKIQNVKEMHNYFWFILKGTQLE